MPHQWLVPASFAKPAKHGAIVAQTRFRARRFVNTRLLRKILKPPRYCFDLLRQVEQYGAILGRKFANMPTVGTRKASPDSKQTLSGRGINQDFRLRLIEARKDIVQRPDRSRNHQACARRGDAHIEQAQRGHSGGIHARDVEQHGITKQGDATIEKLVNGTLVKNAEVSPGQFIRRLMPPESPI